MQVHTPYIIYIQPFTNHRTAGEEGGHFFNSSLPLPPAPQILRHQPGNYCRELTFAHRQLPDSNPEPLVSEHKSLTTKLHAPYIQARCNILFHLGFTILAAFCPTVKQPVPKLLYVISKTVSLMSKASSQLIQFGNWEQQEV